MLSQTQQTRSKHVGLYKGLNNGINDRFWITGAEDRSKP